MKSEKLRGMRLIFLIFMMGFMILIIGDMIVANELRKWTIATHWVAHLDEIIISTRVISYLFLIFAFIAIIKLNKRTEKYYQNAQQLEREKLALQENKRIELEFGLNAFKLGFWKLNLETNIAEQSLLHSQIFGYPTVVPKWTYETFLSHVHPDDVARVEHIIKDALSKGLSWEFQCRIYRANDSSLRWIEVFSELLTLDGCKYALGLVKDITERKNTESSLQKTKEKLNALLQGIPDCLIISNKEGQITFANSVAEKIFGYTLQEIIGQKVEFLLPSRYQTQHVKYRRQYYEKPKLRPMGTGLDLVGQHKDGHEFPVEISLSPIESEEGLLVIAAIRDITKEKILEQKLKHLAEHDPLTGLINRTIFEDRVNQAVALTKRQKGLMAVCFIDLDDFKEVNDQYGHIIGDQLLCAVAKRIQKSLRALDSLARLGGDEFALLLTEIRKKQDVISIVKKLLSEIAKGFLINNINLMVTLSIGISLFPKYSASSLIDHADVAMYYVKKHGKNNYKFYDDKIC